MPRGAVSETEARQRRGEPKAPLAVTRVLRQQIEQTAKDILGDTGLEVTVSGFPVLRLDIVDAIPTERSGKHRVVSSALARTSAPVRLL